MSGSKGQRTKGNVRPSSSGRAAQLLGQSGQSYGFVGFGALSGDLGYVPASPLTDDTDTSVDSDFRMVMRKLSKKDATTKLKSILEFGNLCKEKDADIVKKILPYWPRIYNKISLDNDRRIREASQQALEQLTQRVRRDLAPYLKNIMGTWLLGQCDTYAPAASAAKSAFQAAFPPAKQVEAVTFCQDEIINTIKDNLLNQTLTSVGDAKLMSKEEMEQKYTRIVTSSLLAWQMFISMIPGESSVQEKYRDILKDSKFWKLAKNTNHSIRGAMYSCLGCLCQYTPVLVQEFGAKICPLLLHNLDEMEPQVAGPVWEASLQAICAIENCWEYVSMRKGLLPKLKIVLRSGGSGNANVVYPIILPLLSKIPRADIGEGYPFYEEFFDNMKHGLKQVKIMASPSDCGVILQTFIECLQYSIVNLLPGDIDTQKQLVKQQLFTVLRDSLTIESPVFSNTALYPMTVSLFHYLHKNSSTSEGLNDLLHESWTSLDSLYESVMDTVLADTTMSYSIDRIGKLHVAFKTNQTETEKAKKGKVKFLEITVSSQEDMASKATDNVSKRDSQDFDSSTELDEITNNLCLKCLKHFDNVECQVTMMTLLARILTAYCTDRLLGTLLESLYIPVSSGSQMSKEFVSMVLLPKISQANISAIRPLVDIAVAVYNHADRLVKTDMLEILCQKVESPTAFHLFFENIKDNELVKKWLKKPVFGEKIVYYTDRLCHMYLHTETMSSQDVDSSWALLNLSLTLDDQFEPMIDEAYVDKILERIRTALPSPDHFHHDDAEEITKCVMLVCDVAFNFFKNLKGCLMLKSAEDLLFSVFQLQLQENCLEDKIKKRIQETWLLGAKALLQQKGGFLSEEGFLCKAAVSIKSVVQENCSTIERLQTTIETVQLLISLISMELEDTVDQDTNSIVSAYVDLILVPLSAEDSNSWQRTALIQNSMLFSSIDNQLQTVSKNELPKIVSATLFNASLLQIRGTHNMVDLLYARQYCHTMCGSKQQAWSHSQLGKVFKMLDVEVNNNLESLKHGARLEVLKDVMERSLEHGTIWSLVLGYIINRLVHDMPTSPELNVMQLAGGINRFEDLTEASINTLLNILPFLCQDDLATVTDIMAARVLSVSFQDVMHVIGASGYLRLVTSALSTLCANYNEESSSIICSLLDVILQWNEDGKVAFDCTISPEEWSVVNLNIQILSILEHAVTTIPTKLSSAHWDFMMCSLVTCFQVIYDSVTSLSSDILLQVFCVRACNMLSAVSICMTSVLPEQREQFPENLLTEWLEFFSESIFGALLPLYVKINNLLGDLKDVDLTPEQDYLLRSLSTATSHCPLQLIKDHKLEPNLKADQESMLPLELQTLLNDTCPMLIWHERSVQVTSFNLLHRLVTELSQYDDPKDNNSDDVSRSPPVALMEVIETSSIAVEHILDGLKLGETMIIEPFIDEYRFTFGYLLAWKLVLAFFKSAKPELKAMYAMHLRDSKAVDALLRNVFSLMPETPSIQMKDLLTTQPPLLKLSNIKNMFGDDPLLVIKDDPTSVELQHLACNVYQNALESVPAMVRQWWNEQDRHSTSIIDRFTSKHVTPLLCSNEMQAIQDKNVKFDNMTIKVRTGAREVIATYTVDEFTMELVILLPANYPLGHISVESGKRIGVATTQWRNWMLQLTTFLAHQNGSIVNGLTLWKRNVDKRFEGVEECMICFAVIHGSNYQLPKLQCKTCKKKFHSACLYKWFSTSNNSTCPLCRNLF